MVWGWVGSQVSSGGLHRSNPITLRKFSLPFRKLFAKIVWVVKIESCVVSQL
jgi:hypothetical protein